MAEPATDIVQAKVETAVTRGVNKAVASDNIAVAASAAPALIDILVRQIMPVILHSTNQEPWYRSKVFWSAMLGLIATVLGIFGIAFDATTQQIYLGVIMALIPLASAVLALWGRYATPKPKDPGN